jgi:hypothetical protein
VRTFCEWGQRTLDEGWRASWEASCRGRSTWPSRRSVEQCEELFRAGATTVASEEERVLSLARDPCGAMEREDGAPR